VIAKRVKSGSAIRTIRKGDQLDFEEQQVAAERQATTN
jgi:hypothetical protein